MKPVIAIPSSIVVWITLLSSGLHGFLGAEISTGWIIAGTLVTIAGIFLLMLLRETFSGLCSPELQQAIENSRPHPAQTDVTARALGMDLIDWNTFENHRAELGLGSHGGQKNRRRMSCVGR